MAVLSYLSYECFYDFDNLFRQKLFDRFYQSLDDVISISRYSDLHPVLNLIAQSEIPELTIKLVFSLFSYP